MLPKNPEKIAAATDGRNWYKSNSVCVRGHKWRRYTKSGRCIDCALNDRERLKSQKLEKRNGKV